MFVRVFSVDATESVPCPDSGPYAPVQADGLTPIRRSPTIDRCKVLWSGEMSFAPEDGDTFSFSDGTQLVVVGRAFCIIDDSPMLSVFVSLEDPDDVE